MSDDLAAVKERIMTQTVVSVEDTARACEVSVNRLYGWIREGREIVPGVRAIHVGSRIRVPARPLARVLGLLDEDGQA